MSQRERPKRFELVRTEDVSGTSGTGVVATGVEYPNGGFSFKPAPDGVKATEIIHGHGGRTVVEYIDE